MKHEQQSFFSVSETIDLATGQTSLEAKKRLALVYLPQMRLRIGNTELASGKEAPHESNKDNQIAEEDRLRMLEKWKTQEEANRDRQEENDYTFAFIPKKKAV